jgi:putative Mn2+ efflux pump MntP
VSAPRFRRYATPLGIALISAITGRSIGVRLQPVLGTWAAVIGIAILVAGLCVAIFTWRRRRK